MARSDSTASGKRELLAEESVDEASAAHFAAIFQAAEGDQQLAPLRQVRLARQHFAEDHAVAAQQHPAGGFDHLGAVRALAGIEQRPASGGVARPRELGRAGRVAAAAD